MILIGQYDSPFVRRAAIALRMYGLGYEHRPWSVWGDADKIAPFNPLIRVPVLVLDDGQTLIESGAILEFLDENIGPSDALMAPSGPRRHHAQKICALATGIADKAVSWLYARVLYRSPSARWTDRCRAQIVAALEELARDRARAIGPYWYGKTLSHADIAVACAIRFVREAHPGVFDPCEWPGLSAHAARCESLDVFRDAAQALLPPREAVS